MNNTILSTNTQEKVVFFFGNAEIYSKLIKAGIDKDDISTDNGGTTYVRPEHHGITDKICVPYGIAVHLMPGSFDAIKKSDTLEYLKAKKSALLLHHGDQITEYVSLDKAISKMDDADKKKLTYSRIKSLGGNLRIRLADTRTKDILGLNVKFVESISTHMFGLRGLIALVAAPNCGKTVFVGQCITDALRNNPDTCAVFISLEMEKDKIMERMVRAEAQLTFKEMNLKCDPKEEQDRARLIESAIEKIESFDSRLAILGKEDCTVIDSKQVINLVNSIKADSGCSRSILVIDYLQIWPIDYDQIKSKSDLESDKWLMAQMQILQEIYIDDPAIIICEARKSAAGVSNRLTLADISGSARLGYGFEAALSINPYSDDDQLFHLGKKLLNIKGHTLPVVKKC